MAFRNNQARRIYLFLPCVLLSLLVVSWTSNGLLAFTPPPPPLAQRNMGSRYLSTTRLWSVESPSSRGLLRIPYRMRYAPVRSYPKVECNLIAAKRR